MNFTVICVGKLKEKFWRDACAEYVKRLWRFGQLDIVELSESRSDDKAEESAAILSRIPKGAYVIALDICGRVLSSEDFAAKLSDLAIGGASRIAFIIGGSCGYDDSVRASADMRLSFSLFNFTHQLMRVILLEQLYRACKINANEKYHK